MHCSVVDFFYWITEEDELVAREVMGSGPEAQMRYIQMLATLALANSLRVRGVSHEIVDAGKLVLQDTCGNLMRVGCVASHPFATTFLVPKTCESGWIAVVQLDLERKTSRFLGWYLNRAGDCSRHMSHSDLSCVS